LNGRDEKGDELYAAAAWAASCQAGIICPEQLRSSRQMEKPVE